MIEFFDFIDIMSKKKTQKDLIDDVKKDYETKKHKHQKKHKSTNTKIKEYLDNYKCLICIRWLIKPITITWT